MERTLQLCKFHCAWEWRRYLLKMICQGKWSPLHLFFSKLIYRQMQLGNLFRRPLIFLGGLMQLMHLDPSKKPPLWNIHKIFIPFLLKVFFACEPQITYLKLSKGFLIIIQHGPLTHWFLSQVLDTFSKAIVTPTWYSDSSSHCMTKY